MNKQALIEHIKEHVRTAKEDLPTYFGDQYARGCEAGMYILLELVEAGEFDDEVEPATLRGYNLPDGQACQG